MANLEYRYGPMNSGKSMAILQMAYNYEENNKKIPVFTGVFYLLFEIILNNIFPRLTLYFFNSGK